jgi:hypothetical protein
MTSETDQLIALTRNWNQYEDIPRSQQQECRSIGIAIFERDGLQAMRDAYYAAKAANPYVHVIAAYWDGIGGVDDWRW